MTNVPTEGNDGLDYRLAPSAQTVNARGGDDTIQGSRFDDAFNGGAGNDAISGGAGNDRINGGDGVDRLQGGSGNDLFIFRAGELDTNDQINDFAIAGRENSSEQDFIRFEGFGAGARLVDLGDDTSGRFQRYQVVDADGDPISGVLRVQVKDDPSQRLVSVPGSVENDYVFA